MGCSDALFQRVRELFVVGQDSLAESILRRAISTKGADAGVFATAGEVLLNAGRFTQGEFYLRRALSLKADASGPTLQLAQCLMGQQKFDEGHAILRKLLDRNPADSDARVVLATSLRRMNKTASALALLKEAIGPNINNAGVLNAYAHTLHAIGRVEDAVPRLRSLAAQMPDHVQMLDGFCSVLNYCPGVSSREILDTHERYGRLLEREAGPRQRPRGAGGERGPGRPLRVGILSSDLRDHVVPMFLMPFLAHANREKVHLTCFNCGPVEDGVSAQMRGMVDGWHWLKQAQPEKIAEAVTRERIDVLIELNGHTRGQKLGAMALRPAPVQMTYLGYPATTGLRSIDYRLVDWTTDPEGAEAFTTERLLRVDPCFLCMRPPRDLPAVSTRPSGGPITFVSFTNLLKVSTPLLGLWAKVLQAVPGSRLLMKHFSLTEEEVREDLRARLGALGIGAERLDFRPPLDTRGDHLAAYAEADICLDTTPYNGTTTIFESLLMGVPVVTLSGTMHAGRVTESILRQVGLSDLVAPNENEYVVTAACLAADRSRLADLRRVLRERVLKSALCDEKAHGARMVDALHHAWREVGAMGTPPAVGSSVSSAVPRAAYYG